MLLISCPQFVADEEQVMISHNLSVLATIVLTNPSSPTVAAYYVYPLTVGLTPCRWFCSEVRMMAMETLIRIWLRV